MDSDTDLTLESDRLEEKLETAAPAQQVVVVQYRNRGVPSWVFPLILLMPAMAIVTYHRSVVERYRVQAAQARQALEALAANNPRVLPPAKEDHPKTTTAPAENTVIASLKIAETSGSALSTPATAPGPIVNESQVPPGSGKTASASTANPPGAVPTADAAAVTVAGPAQIAETPAKTTRTILPNPFADGALAPIPPNPGEAMRVADRQGEPPNPNRDVAGPDVQAGPKPLQPLPTKEEMERQIEGEAARKQADIASQLDHRQASLRSQRIEEQLKFRHELSEVLRAHGNRAGPEIDNLAKRYGYESDPARFDKAFKAWRFSRLSQHDKVKYIRSLELPETVILDFLSDDLNAKKRTREGPRNDSEVRARAAATLLRYAFPDDGAEKRPAAGVGSAPRRTQPLPQRDAALGPR